MAGNIKGVTLDIGGNTTSFQKALKDMSVATRSTQNELNAVNKALKFDPKNVDLLKQKEELLAKQLEDVRIRVEKMKEAKAKADAEMANGTEINQEQYRILVREISAAEGQLKSLIRQNDKFGNSARELGDHLETIGKKGMVLSGAILGIGSAAVGLGIKAAQSADDINTLSKQTGLSTEQIQKFQYASERIDVPLETLTGSMAKLTRNMQSAKNGSKNTQLAFDELGISITDNEGKLRSNQDVFNEAIDALAKMEDGTQRDALAMQIFGKSAQDLNPLILGGADALEQYGEEAEAAGLILSQETLDSANELNDAVDKLKATAVGSFAKIGSEIATKLTPLMKPAADKLVKVVDVISDLDDAQLKLIGGIGIGLATIPPLLIGTGKMITAIGTISTAYKTMAASATAASIASKAIPFIGVVSGAIALVGAISKVTSATDEETKKTRELHETNLKRYEDYQKNKKVAEEQAKASLSEISYIEKLKDELIELADETGRVEDSEKSRATFILGELNAALGTEYRMTGNIVGGIKEMSIEIDKLLTKRKAEIILSEKEDAFEEAIKNIETSAEELKKSMSAYEKAKKEYDDYAKSIENSDATGRLATLEKSKLKGLKVILENKKEAYDEDLKVHEEYLSDIEDYENTQISINEDGGKKIVAELMNRTTVLTEEQKKAGNAYNDAIVDLAEYTEKYKKGVEGYTEAGLKELQDNVVKTKEEAENLGISINEGLVVGLSDDKDVKNAISKLCDNIPQWAKDFLGINSPAKVAIPIGEAISQGIAVGIKRDMSAEEKLEKKCSNLKKILSEYTDDFKTDVGLAESEYDLWLYDNPNASETEKASHQKAMHERIYAANQKNVQNINDALWYQGELTGTDSPEYRKILSELNDAKIKTYKAEEALIEAGEALIKSELTPKFSQANIDLAESEYELWKARNPEATEYEDLLQQEKKLNVEYEEQGNKVQDLNDELYIQIQLNGENAEESKKLLAQLNEEKAAYEDLGREIENVNKQKSQYIGIGISDTSGGLSAASQYAAYHVQYGAMLKSQGVSQEQIDAAARKVSGYAGGKSIEINNYISGTTPDTAYKVVQETQKTANNLAMQGVL